MPLIDFVMDVSRSIYSGVARDAEKAVHSLENQHLKTHTGLTMFAPQEVLDSYDRLMDYLFDCIDREELWDWDRMSKLRYEFLNSVRADLAISPGEVSYRGKRGK